MNYFAFAIYTVAFMAVGSVGALVVTDALTSRSSWKWNTAGLRMWAIVGALAGLLMSVIVAHTYVNCDLRNVDNIKRCEIVWR